MLPVCLFNGKQQVCVLSSLDDDGAIYIKSVRHSESHEEHVWIAKADNYRVELS